MATRLFLLVPAISLLCLTVSGNSTVYTVGGRAGWDISADLASWVASKIFYVDDSLVFQYSQYHSVSEVDKAGYESCDVASPLLTSSNGNTTVELTAAGDRYFVCGNQLHCLGGMKLQVSVVGNETAASGEAQSPTTSTAQAESPATLPFPSDGAPFSSGSRGRVASCMLVCAWSAVGSLAVLL
ncbi:stellacyanin-like [Curcuma longa]|uniref:stellacyanin-like n=1 Tax=Curcuma longa TaxID=136217 RepID=UPI003D9E4F60